MLTLSEGKGANATNVMTAQVMEIHLFAKNKSAPPVTLVVQKLATSRSNVIRTSYTKRTEAMKRAVST